VADPSPAGRAPATADEEIIYADNASVLSERSEAERLRRIERELVFGFNELGKIGPAICVFGSARIPRNTSARARRAARSARRASP
jgi:hypothetical protein